MLVAIVDDFGLNLEGFENTPGGWTQVGAVTLTPDLLYVLRVSRLTGVDDRIDLAHLDATKSPQGVAPESPTVIGGVGGVAATGATAIDLRPFVVEIDSDLWVRRAYGSGTLASSGALLYSIEPT